MALFSKKKEENSKVNLPPPPPSVSSPNQNNTNMNNNSISNQNQNLNSPNEAMAFKSEDKTLTPPPVPGIENLSEIKNEVAGVNKFSNMSNSNSSEIEISSQNQLYEKNNSEEDQDDLKLTGVDDSLFNLDELDFPKGEYLEDKENKEIENKSMEKDEDFEFLEKTNRHIKEDSPIFITTNQFKEMMTMIDDIKFKLKESSETYLRLMDIKAEEDIEFENLRKSFQFFEEKLYQIDNILFEK
jgi:hypothetical protein